MADKTSHFRPPSSTHLNNAKKFRKQKRAMGRSMYMVRSSKRTIGVETKSAAAAKPVNLPHSLLAKQWMANKSASPIQKFKNFTVSGNEASVRRGTASQCSSEKLPRGSQGCRQSDGA